MLATALVAEAAVGVFKEAAQFGRSSGESCVNVG